MTGKRKKKFAQRVFFCLVVFFEKRSVGKKELYVFFFVLFFLGEGDFWKQIFFCGGVMFLRKTKKNITFFLYPHTLAQFGPNSRNGSRTKESNVMAVFH